MAMLNNQRVNSLVKYLRALAEQSPWICCFLCNTGWKRWVPKRLDMSDCHHVGCLTQMKFTGSSGSSGSSVRKIIWAWKTKSIDTSQTIKREGFSICVARVELEAKTKNALRPMNHYSIKGNERRNVNGQKLVKWINQSIKQSNWIMTWIWPKWLNQTESEEKWICPEMGHTHLELQAKRGKW